MRGLPNIFISLKELSLLGFGLRTVVVVDDGKVLAGNLSKLNHSEKWLQEQLRKVKKEL